MSDTHGSTDEGQSANRRSVLRKVAAGATGIVGLTAASGTGSAHTDCDGRIECRGGRQYVVVECEDGHTPADQWIGTYC